MLKEQGAGGRGGKGRPPGYVGRLACSFFTFCKVLPGHCCVFNMTLCFFQGFDINWMVEGLMVTIMPGVISNPRTTIALCHGRGATAVVLGEGPVTVTADSPFCRCDEARLLSAVLCIPFCPRSLYPPPPRMSLACSIT